MNPDTPNPTRRQLLAGGGLVAVATLRGADSAAAATPALAPQLTDADRLHRLLGLELLMLYCYEHVLGTPLLKPRAKRLLSPLIKHEEAHVRVLSGRLRALGGTPPPPPLTDTQANRDLARRSIGGRLGHLQGSRDALYLLLAIEQVVVGAYFVALIKLGDERLITVCAQVMANEAQHQALVGEALYPGNAPDAVPSGLVQGVQ